VQGAALCVSDVVGAAQDVEAVGVILTDVRNIDHDVRDAGGVDVEGVVLSVEQTQHVSGGGLIEDSRGCDTRTPMPVFSIARRVW